MTGPSPESLAKSGSEAAEQTALFCWAALPENQKRFPELKFMFHVPNGGTRDKREAGAFKAQGVKPGVPDICLPVRRLQWSGLWIEMKYGNNRPSPEQNAYLTFLQSQGFATVVCYSWVHASQMVESYLTME